MCWCCVGILLWSIGLIKEGHDLLGGLVFAVLLNMKHLFACLAPLYFVYLFRHYCRQVLIVTMHALQALPHWMREFAPCVCRSADLPVISCFPLLACSRNEHAKT